MINYRIIAKILGILLYIEAILLLGCTLFSIGYRENDLVPFLISAGITVVAATLLYISGRKAPKKVNRKDGYLIVTASWLTFTLFGMLPYLLGGYVDGVTNAFFETMSGFTTTGSSIMDNIESQPHGILFWRSLTQWLGGLGIVFFTIAILPVFGSGGLKLFAAETTGPTHSKTHPRIEMTAKWIWSIYLTLTIVLTVLLIAGDMPIFDSVCTALCTTATGGMSVRQSSIATYASPYIEYIISLFMIISGINFALLYVSIIKGRIRRLFKDLEFKWYIGSMIIFILFVTVALLASSDQAPEECFRLALFQVSSLQTTTGFVTADYMFWPSCTWLVLCITMIFGGCAGSTSGAMKCIRFALLYQVIRNHLRRMTHPNAVLPVRFNETIISSDVKNSLLAFVCVYAGLILVGWVYMLCIGIDFMESFGIVVSSLGNVGPGLGSTSPAYSWNHLPDAAKWGCSALMLIGRLELFSVLLLFSSGFWKKQ